MHYELFTILDTKVGSFQQPFYARSKGEAIRTITSTLRSNDSILSQYPDDFVLFQLGSFNDLNAEFDISCSPERMGSLSEYLPSSSE